MAPHILARECDERDNRRDDERTLRWRCSEQLRLTRLGRVQSFAIIFQSILPAKCRHKAGSCYMSILTPVVSDRLVHVVCRISFQRVLKRQFSWLLFAIWTSFVVSRTFKIYQFNKTFLKFLWSNFTGAYINCCCAIYKIQNSKFNEFNVCLSKKDSLEK